MLDLTKALDRSIYKCDFFIKSIHRTQSIVGIVWSSVQTKTNSFLIKPMKKQKVYKQRHNKYTRCYGQKKVIYKQNRSNKQHYSITFVYIDGTIFLSRVGMETKIFLFCVSLVQPYMMRYKASIFGILFCLHCLSHIHCQKIFDVS